MTNCDCEHHAEHGCATIKPFERPTYHFGQMLGQQDFLAQHDYLADKLALVSRYGIGHGVACGLEVKPVPIDNPRCEDLSPIEKWKLVFSPGVAIDCEGRLIVLRKPMERRLIDLVTECATGKAISEGSLWVSICFTEEGSCPSRPLPIDSCDPCGPVPFARFRDGVRIDTTADEPGNPCDECCGSCAGQCVVLVRLDLPSEERATLIVADLRQPLGKHLTTIDGVSWIHAGDYPADQAATLLKNLRVSFSDDVRAGDLNDATIEVRIRDLGGDNRGMTYCPKTVLTVSADAFTRSASLALDEVPGYREYQVLVTVRGDHILDHCCRAIDANHIGGAVSRSSPLEPPIVELCKSSWRRERQLGNGTEGGTFESWFYVGRSQTPAGGQT
jgi:hypothetical protein